MPLIIKISFTPSFHFASSNPSFFIDPVSSTISKKRFFRFIIHEFTHKQGNSIRSGCVIPTSLELNHDCSFDLADDLPQLVSLPHPFEQHGTRFIVIFGSFLHVLLYIMVIRMIEIALIQIIISLLYKGNNTIFKSSNSAVFSFIIFYFKLYVKNSISE